jgi:hypothetical protein
VDRKSKSISIDSTQPIEDTKQEELSVETP